MNKIILAGFGGQGILFAGKVIANAAMLRNKYISWLPSYGPEMRGGTANCSVIVSEEPVGSPIITCPDSLIVMNRPSLDKFENEAAPGAVIVADSSLVGRKTERDDVRAVYVNATEKAEKIGVKTLANMVMLGAYMKVSGLFTVDEIKETIRKCVPSRRAALIEDNIRAFEAGYNMVK